MLHGLPPAVLQAALDEHPELLQMLLRGVGGGGGGGGVAGRGAGPLGAGRGEGDEDWEDGPPQEVACRVA
jgi:hypothetical protein